MLLLGWAAFRPPTAQAQTCATAPVNLDYRVSNTTNAYVAGDWRNRASAPAPDASSFTRVGTTYSSADANSTLATGTLNGQTLAWTTTYASAANASTGSTVTYTFSRPVTNLVVRVQDIDAVFVPANPGGLLGIGATPSNGFTDEVTFTATNGTTTNIQPTLTRANAVTKYVAISGNKATGIPAGGNNATTDDATIIATYPGTITSFTLQYRNVTTATEFQGQVIGIDNISWCRIAPTAAPVTTTTVVSSSTQANIRSLSGTADGILSYTITSLPTNGTLLYNTTGTTYAPVALNQSLTPAQASSLRYTPNASFTGSSTTFTYQAKDDQGLTSPAATYTIPLQFIAACGTTTNTLDFSTRTAGEDWTARTNEPVPAGATTTISSGNYSVSTPNTASTLRTGTVNSNTLAWNNDYSTTSPGRTSKVTFTFSREVSNFAVQVQDIDGVANSFIDVVTFEGANAGNTSVTPFLSVANPSAGVVTVSGNVATGQTATSSTVDGTVTAYFPNPIKTLTITYANGVPNTVTDPASQFIGIDKMSWCRSVPVANNVTTTPVLSTATQAGIRSLSGSTPDGGTIASYVITSLPTNGTLLYGTAGGNYAPVALNQSLTAAQASSLRYSANQSFQGTSTTFTYRAVDEVGASSTNTATYTIPLQYLAPCGTATNTFAFGSRPANEDWKNHAALAVPTGATTTISSGAYSADATNPASAFQISSVNTVNALGWSNDYSGTGRTSKVTFTFSRAVSNFTTRILDIDGAAGNFIDVVTFAGANNGTSVTPYLSAENPSAGVVTISGATATGQTTTDSPVDGTVTVSFPSAINTFTITYVNGVSGTVADPGFQVIGIENMTWCRLAPTASPVTVASMSNASAQLPISSLNGTAPDGTIKSYTIAALPPATEGVLYVNGVLLNTTNFPGLVLTPTQAGQLTFDPTAGFVGTSTFNYLATDDANIASNSTTYSIPVSAVPPPAACANPGKDGSPTLASNPNTYFPGTASAAQGATSITIGTGTLGSGAAANNISAGDLLLVIQMQGADINSTNTDAYGDGVAGGGASGNLTTNFQAGVYEYVVATNTTPITTAGGILTLAAPLVNSYVSSAASTTAGPRRFQVVRIPQYTNLTLSGTLTATPWNGSIGGIIALDVAGQTNFGGNTINASGRGFRGGGGRTQATAAGANNDYVATTTANAHAQKGEGTAGTPRYVNVPATPNDAATNATSDTGIDGYAGGPSGRGAPGNAGGGGNNNIDNSGGGGGANGGIGGRGGNNFSGNQAIGGEPGASFSVATSSRLVMGGGGGAGTTNNNSGTPANGPASSGAAGGGIVLLRSGTITGTGTILANGGDANSSTVDDGGGGGGAGGAILITASSTSTLTLNANGGTGGNTNPATTSGPHGPGGGGGGGVIFTTSGVTATLSAAGGANGTTVATNNTRVAYGAAAGLGGVTNTGISNSIAGSTAGANCVADVATTITGPASISAGQPTGNFTVMFSNIGAGSATSVAQRVALPTGAGLTATQQAAIVAAYPGTTFTTTGSGTSAITTIDFGTLAQLPSGNSVSYSFAYTAPTTLGTASTESTTSTTTQELGQTANNRAAFSSTVTAVADVTVALSGPTTLNAGQPTGTFTATFTNEGPNPATNVSRIVTLPSGATVSQAQQDAIRAAYPNANLSFATPGVIDFGPLASLASDARSVVMFNFTAPETTGASNLRATTSTSVAEGSNTAPNTSTLALNTIATADVVATITASATPTIGTFTVTFNNRGPQTADGVVRTVQLPAGLTGSATPSANPDGSSNNGVTVSDGYYNATTGLVVYNTSPTSIAANSPLTSTITYNLTSSQTPVVATASVSTTTNEAGLTQNNAMTAVMPAQFDLATTLTGPATTIAGSPTMLYVTTTNNGPNSAPVASQTVLIPSDAPLTDVYITNGGTYVYNSTQKVGTVTFPALTNLPNGEKVVNSISFSAPAANFAPSAVIAPTSGDTNTANNTAYLNGSTTSTPMTVTNTTLAKTNEGTTITADATIVRAGSVVTYTVTSFNNGFLNTTSVNNVVERVQLLPGLTSSLANPGSSTLTVGGVSGTQAGNIITFVTAAGTTTYDAATGVLTYPTLASQASGSSYTYDKLMVTVPANTGNNGQLLATASVSTDSSDPVPADNSSSVVVKVVTTSDMTARITGPSATAAGQTVSYTATFTNQGTGSATSAVETAQLPAGLTNVLVQDANGNVITNAYNPATGLVTFPAVANAPAGSTQVYSIWFAAPAQSFSVSSYVSSGTTDVASTNNSSLVRTTVSPAADVAVYLNGPATAVAGNAITYAVTTANNGPSNASAVQATLQLPAGLSGTGTVVTNPDGSSNNGVIITGGGTYNATTGLVTFPSFDLAAGDSRVGLVTFTMPSSPANGQLRGTASVSTTSTDLVAGNNSSAIATGVAPATTNTADLATSITSPASPAVAGTTVSYTVKFSNLSTTTAAIKVMPTAYLTAGLTNVVVRDANGVVVPNAYNSTTGQVVLPTIDSQAPGNETSYTISLTTPANALAISASAVSSNTSDPNPSNNVSGSQLSITPAYDVVTSLAGPTTAQPGSVNTYSVTTTNNGPSTSSATANSTTQTVKVPANSIVGDLPVGASYDSGTGVITFPAISGQAAGANGAVANSFTVVMPATGNLDLTATVTAAGESNLDNNDFTLTTTQANQAPVAQNIWNTLRSARGNTANQQAPGGLLISPLNATDADGTVSKYAIVSLPDPTQGVLYLSNGTRASIGDVPAAGLYFAPTVGYVGNATFTFQAIDNRSAVSNTALYTIPVAQDQSSAYTTYNSGKSVYSTGEVLAQAVDPNAAVYSSNGSIYSPEGALLAGSANGLANAVLASGTLPTGVSIDPATGRIYVSDASALPQLTRTTSYSLQVTTTDANGGASTVPVTFALGATPLPVVLTDFTAQAVQNRDAQLSWHTASEQNNDHFEVERSFDGTTFVKIGQVAGQGTTTSATVYAFNDANVAAKASGPVYYRLRQVDHDGTATYSPLRTVKFQQLATRLALSLYPNPAQTSTTLDLSALPTTGTYQVLLLDATGRTVRTATLGGGLPQPLSISDLAIGTYQVLVTGQLADGTAVRQVLRLVKE
nr:Ig-like domain-containing protein [Hymenobacter sp. BT559]